MASGEQASSVAKLRDGKPAKKIMHAGLPLPALNRDIAK
jgi:hypothetical protein